MPERARRCALGYKFVGTKGQEGFDALTLEVEWTLGLCWHTVVGYFFCNLHRPRTIFEFWSFQPRSVLLTVDKPAQPGQLTSDQVVYCYILLYVAHLSYIAHAFRTVHTGIL